MTVAASVALASQECTVPGCVQEAEPGERYCRIHIADQRRNECKVDGCHNPAAVKVGVYARLCEQHRNEARASGSSGRSTPTQGALTLKARAIVPLAVKLERLRAKLDALPAIERAKAEFDEASRRASVAPTPENLERVQASVEALKKSAPRRTKLETDISHAERELGLALQALVKAVRE